MEYLRQEHAKMIEGLHSEIQRLQEQCTTLHFRLNFSDSQRTAGCVSSATQTDLFPESNSEVSNELVESLKSQLEDITKSLGIELHNKTEQIISCRQQMNEDKTQNKALEEKLNQLESELEAKNKTIAFLTAQLHQVKMKLSCKSTEKVTRSNATVIQSLSAIEHPRRILPKKPIHFLSSWDHPEESFDNLIHSSKKVANNPIHRKLFVPSPPADKPSDRPQFQRHYRRLSAEPTQITRSKSQCEFHSLPVYSEDNNIHILPIRNKTPNSKLYLPPISSATSMHDTLPYQKPIVNTLKPKNYKNTPKGPQPAHATD